MIKREDEIASLKRERDQFAVLLLSKTAQLEGFREGVRLAKEWVKAEIEDYKEEAAYEAALADERGEIIKALDAERDRLREHADALARELRVMMEIVRFFQGESGLATARRILTRYDELEGSDSA